MIKYRPDIDGLRAVAVLPVVLFHSGIPRIEGGYVGVDVFFVISGFLISKIIITEVDEERFSYARFYERRIRRLLPALFVVVLATIPPAIWLLTTKGFKDFGQSLAAVGLFSSNILFFAESGYFDAESHTKPLLHTWSLAVEEQFYLFFPPILLLIRRLARTRMGHVLVALSILSFAASVWMVATRPSAAFYLLPFRAWELLLGALLAIRIVPAHRSVGVNSAIGATGLALVAVAVATYDETTPFPGVAALLPCIGTAAVIYAGSHPRAFAHRLLGWSPLVLIGKASYSIYLWHWPVIVFATMISLKPRLDTAGQFGLTVASLVLGLLSWKFIETPFRKKSAWTTPRYLFAGAAAATAFWIGFGIFAHVLDGVPQRLSDEALRFGYATTDFSPSPDHCGRWTARPEAADLCLIGDATLTPSFVVWGDSHAGVLVHGVIRSAERFRRSGLFSMVAGCPAFFGVSKDESVADAADDAKCAEHNQRIETLLAAAPEIATVLMVGRWSYYAEGLGIGNDAHHRVKIWFDDDPPADREQAEVFQEAFARTLRRLSAMGKRVFVLQQVPEFEQYGAQTLAVEATVSGPDAVMSKLEVPRTAVDARQSVFERFRQESDAFARVEVLSTREYFCDSAVCRAVKDGRALYLDNNHVTNTTARELSPTYDPMFTASPLTETRR